MLFSTKCSKKFIPFMLLMPLSVLKGKKDRKDTDELDMFNPGNSDKVAQMKDSLWKLISAYTYDKKDENAFFSNVWRQSLGINYRMSHTLKANRLPKIQKFNKGQNEYVVCWIDPLRLFHDMLTDTEHKDASFRCIINSTDQIKGGNFKYEVYRSINGKKKNSDRSIEDKIAWEINQRLNN
jgi:hypothetical protein